MAPEDVPDELARTAAEAYYGHAVPDGGFAVLRGPWQRALAAVLPAHEAMIRAKVAAEIDQLRTIRTLQAMWAKLGTHGLPVEREVWAQVARDLGKVLGQPGAQPKLLAPKGPPREPSRSTHALHEEPGDQEGTT